MGGRLYFYRAPACEATLLYSNSVTVPKQLNISSKFFYVIVAKSLYFLKTRRRYEISEGSFVHYVDKPRDVWLPQ